MKKILPILLMLSAFTSFGAERLKLTVTATNAAVTSNTLTVNGVTRTWTNAASSTTIATNLLSKNATATNLFNGYSAFPIGSGVTHRMENTNVVVFYAPLGASLSGSLSGNWGTAVVSTQSGPSTFTAIWPLENMVGETNRTNQGSSLVYGLGQYSTNAFPTNATALSNFVTKGATVGPQIISSELRISGNINNGANRLSASNLVNYGAAFRSEGTGGNSFQVGSNAQAIGNLSLAAGNGATANGLRSIAIGVNSAATNGDNVAVGYGAAAYTNRTVTVGSFSLAEEDTDISIGYFGVVSGPYAVGVGSQTSVTGTNSIGVGTFTVTSGDYATSIGPSAFNDYDYSTAIGYLATTTATNQIMLGTSTETVVVPGVLSVKGTQTNTVFTGTNVLKGRLDLFPGTRTGLANGYNSGTILGTNVYFRMSGPSAAYTNAGFAAAVDGTFHKLQFDNPGLSYTILHDSGLEATAANRIYTGTGALVNSTNNPVFVDLIYDGNASRWRVVAIR